MAAKFAGVGPLLLQPGVLDFCSSKRSVAPYVRREDSPCLRYGIVVEVALIASSGICIAFESMAQIFEPQCVLSRQCT